MPHSAIDRQTRKRARALRREPTEAERRFWIMLRGLKPMGFHFRRQAPIGPYVADFVWHSGKLVFEIDGGQHAEAQASYDQRRTVWLESQGYRVVRLWNNDVLRAPASVGNVVLAEAEGAKARFLTSPTPGPSPQGGGEKRGPADNDR